MELERACKFKLYFQLLGSKRDRVKKNLVFTLLGSLRTSHLTKLNSNGSQIIENKSLLVLIWRMWGFHVCTNQDPLTLKQHLKFQ